MKQPLNEAYPNEVLEAYQKVSDKFYDFTKLICKRIPYEDWPKDLKVDSENLPDCMIDKIQDMGRVEEKILNILEDDIFKKTSKHNPYWESELEQEADKLDDLRMKFACLNDNLWDIISILRKEEEL